MPASARPVSRRTALGATLVGTLTGPVLAGCSLDPPTADPAPGAVTQDEPDADVVLIATVLGSLDGTAALVATAASRHPGLAPRLQPLLGVHAAHRAVLDAAAEVQQEATGAATVPGRPVAALDRVRRAETRLVGTLRSATGEAQSGDLARALASMAAGLTQHLEVLGNQGPAA